MIVRRRYRRRRATSPMLEFALNAVWLTAAIAAFALVRHHGRKSKIAIVCTLALLFPIISVSDDLALDGNSLDEALAIVTALLALVAGFTAVGRIERLVAAPALVHVATPSDPRSPPRA